MSSPDRPAIAWRWLGPLSVAFFALLAATSEGYGYHRDELYFIVIGGHPAFGYVDEPPLVPLLAHGMDAISGHSLVWLRLPSALAGALVVLVTGLTAREFRAGPGGQLLAAAAMAASGILLGSSHLMSTTPYDLLGQTVVIWLAARALRDDGPVWLAAGLVAGVDLEVKTLPAFLLFGLLVGILVAGPRRVLASRWLWGGALIAAALWAPNLVWQATHGWPQLHLASSIAAGNSGSSQPRWAFLPQQLLIMGPVLCPVWIAGLVRLWRDPALRTWRLLPVAYVVLAVVFIATGGKPYYQAGIYPALFAAGAEPALRRVRHGLGVVVVVSAAVSAVVTLPLVPARYLHDTPIVAMNYDAGEQVGWPRFADEVAHAYSTVPGAVVLTANYGEYGALAHYRPDIPVFSGHNSLWDLGPPPADAKRVVVVGYYASDLRPWCASVRRMGTIDNGVHLDNDEQGGPILLCTGLRTSWAKLWPKVRELG